MYLDYLLYMVPALLLSLGAQIYLSSVNVKYSRIMTSRSITGEQAALGILRTNGANDVSVVPIAGKLTDNYNPRNNTISLSQGVMDSPSIAACGVAAHEAGHALQYANGYFPVKLRTAIYPVCSFGAKISPYLIIFGLIMSFPPLYYAGIIAFTAAAFFQLVTLPVEFNASQRAVNALSSTGMLRDDELTGAKRVLTAAALTYVAALFTSLLQILYYLSRVRRR